MYNTLYRTEIENQDHRKFLDTFMGPNAIAASMMSVVRNYVYNLGLRLSINLLIPLTRPGTIKLFQTFTFTVLKNLTFAEGFLHTRFFRQIFETALDYCTFGVFWFMTKYKNKYVDPPPPTTAAPTTTEATTTEEATTITANKINLEYYSATTIPFAQDLTYAPYIDSNVESPPSSTSNYIDVLSSTTEKYLYIYPEPKTETPTIKDNTFEQNPGIYYKDEKPAESEPQNIPKTHLPGKSSNYAYFHTHSKPDKVPKPETVYTYSVFKESSTSDPPETSPTATTPASSTHKTYHKPSQSSNYAYFHTNSNPDQVSKQETAYTHSVYKESSTSDLPETSPTTTTAAASSTYKTYHKPAQSSNYAYFHTYSQPANESTPEPEQTVYTNPIDQDPSSSTSESPETSALPVSDSSSISDIQYLGGLDDLTGPSSIKRVDTIFDGATLSDLRDAIERLDLVLKKKNRQKDGNKTVERENPAYYNQPRNVFLSNPAIHERIVSHNHRQLSTYKNVAQKPRGILKGKSQGPWLRRKIQNVFKPYFRKTA